MESQRISTRLLRKGALIEETYQLFRVWDLQQNFRGNLNRLAQENPIGARNSAWLREVLATISSRFQTTETLRPLVLLAQGGVSLDDWRACLLWQIGQQDVLFAAFLRDWLFPAYEAGRVRLRTDDVVSFVVVETQGRVAGGTELSTYGKQRAARDLLLMATDFGLLQGKVVREFAGYHLHDLGFLYVLHALLEREANPQRIIDAPEWRMYLMQPNDVVQGLLRLHQFRRVEYHAAGSIIHLRLPYPSLLGYAESLAV